MVKSKIGVKPKSKSISVKLSSIVKPKTKTKSKSGAKTKVTKTKSGTTTTIKKHNEKVFFTRKKTGILGFGTGIALGLLTKKYFDKPNLKKVKSKKEFGMNTIPELNLKNTRKKDVEAIINYEYDLELKNALDISHFRKDLVKIKDDKVVKYFLAEENKIILGNKMYTECMDSLQNLEMKTSENASSITKSVELNRIKDMKGKCSYFRYYSDLLVGVEMNLLRIFIKEYILLNQDIPNEIYQPMREALIDQLGILENNKILLNIDKAKLIRETDEIFR